jgi:hypothetical protein
VGSLAVFASAPRILAASVSTANTARDGTGTLATLVGVGWTSAPAAGTKVTSVTVVATGDPAASIVNLFVHDATTAWFFDQFNLGNPAAASATVDAYRASKTYPDLVLPSGYTLRASITAALTAGVVNVFALAGDLT